VRSTPFTRRPGLSSVVGGVLFGVFVLALGGVPIDPVALVLASLLGGVFAVGMYGAFRLVRP
jgi:hypothetical protein